MKLNKDKRYIVMGGVMEYMAHLHCEATSEGEALDKWRVAFPDCPERTFLPEVVSLSERPDMTKHWKYDGHRYYSGGYRYSY